MGDITDMILEGILCQQCGVYIEDDYDKYDDGIPGYPRNCEDCEENGCE